ncbi:AMP-binding protein [Ramlibacter sp. RBP-2]|uniref:AMP-binding protein n=2 Tax=Ramlibacter lithotrophicus TaxID=2606681 RepID=A0A7X6DKS6_9BURK|nr:AMP-binding protein [Ramlibacter lithotrophicus]NKE68899.1 AMP-binding protein [Ramlibacter lithotrophicus]
MKRLGLWPGITLLEGLDEAVRLRRDNVAIVDGNSATGRSTCVTYGELDEHSRHVAAGLSRLGVRRGDVVAVQLPNWWQFAVLHLACLRIGAVINPLMPIFRERELTFMLELAETKVLVIPEEFRKFDHADLGRRLQEKLPTLKHLVVVGTSGPRSFERELLAAVADDATSSTWQPVGPDDVVQVLYTSGTTGEPKGVMHTSNTLFSNLLPYVNRMQLGRDDVILMSSPLAHQTGFMYGLMMPIYLGGRVVLQDVWEPTLAADLIEREKVTYTMASTPFLADLTEVGATRPEAFASLRLFHSAGATIPRALVRDATQRLGATIISGWGMTENGAAATTRPNDRAEKIFETDGCAMDGMELRIVDERGRPLPSGESGHLQVRGCSNFVGYLHRPQLYGTDESGWFTTGDIARIDEDGYLRITGRSKDVVIRGGENIPVVEIEGLLYRHPGVREVAIVGRVDPRLGERCAAYVVPRGATPPTLQELTAWLADAGVSKTYLPEFLRIVSELPKTPTGKIQKFQLRAMEAQLDS